MAAQVCCVLPLAAVILIYCCHPGPSFPVTQEELCHRLLSSDWLTDTERDVLRWGRNATGGRCRCSGLHANRVPLRSILLVGELPTTLPDRPLERHAACLGPALLPSNCFWAAGVTPKRLSDSGLKRETYRAATAIECLVCCASRGADHCAAAAEP